MPFSSPCIAKLLLFCSLVLAVTPRAVARTWTDRSGKFTLEAELVTVKEGGAYLEDAKGSVRKIPFDKLSVADLQYLASLAKYRAELAGVLKDDAAPAAGEKVKFTAIESKVELGSVRQFRSPSWGYDGLVFSPDGGYLVTLGSDNVTVFRINTSQSVFYKIAYSAGRPTSLAITPDGEKVIVGTDDGDMLVWGFARGKLTPEKSFKVADDDIKSIAISPDGRRGLSTHQGGAACLWEVETGKLLGTYSDFHFMSAPAATFSRRGGQGLVTDGQLVALVDTKSHDLLQVMKLGVAGPALSTAVSNDGRRVAAAGGRMIGVCETQTGKSFPQMPTKEIQWSAAFSPTGKRLLTGGSGVVSVWDVEQGQRTHELKLSDSGYVKYVAASPDGRLIAAIGSPIGQLVEVFRLPLE